VISPERSRSVNAGPRSIAARRLIGSAFGLVAAVSMTGCYAFIPTTNTTLAETTPVTVSLTQGGTAALQQVIGQNVNEVEGTVLRSAADSLVIAVEHTYTTTRQKFSSSGTTVNLPRPYIREVKVRTFSKKRTVLFLAGSITGAAVLATSVNAGGGFSSGDGSGGGQPPASVRRP